MKGVVCSGFGGLVFKADRLSHHSTLGSRVIKNKKKFWFGLEGARVGRVGVASCLRFL